MVLEAICHLVSIRTVRPHGPSYDTGICKTDQPITDISSNSGRSFSKRAASPQITQEACERRYSRMNVEDAPKKPHHSECFEGGSVEQFPEHNDTSPFIFPSLESSSPKQDDKFLHAATSIVSIVAELFAENIFAKALRTAQDSIDALPAAFPEVCAHVGNYDGAYSLREAEFWTCGFFPGILSSLTERIIKYPHSVKLREDIELDAFRDQLRELTCAWSKPIRQMDSRTDTHDIGFIVMPSLRLDWELFGSCESLQSIIKAARSLATRFVPQAGAIRSWDILKKKDIKILDQEENLIVIIDSICNLGLLYYAAHQSQDLTLSEIATAHAITLLHSHLRKEPIMRQTGEFYQGQWYSTYHVTNIDPKTGTIKCHLSAQGYHHNSTWSRGQAWGILGYAETYMWTKDVRFLQASCGLSEYFLFRLETAPECVRTARHVPLWDFDAPIQDESSPLRDSSAGVIAANGMLVLSQALTSLDRNVLSRRYRNAALKIVQQTIEFALAHEKALLVADPSQHITAKSAQPGKRYDGILKYGTANNNEHAKKRYADHGLIYGDYYLVEFGNRLLRMGLC